LLDRAIALYPRFENFLQQAIAQRAGSQFIARAAERDFCLIS
jgi:hypothetical protein